MPLSSTDGISAFVEQLDRLSRRLLKEFVTRPRLSVNALEPLHNRIITSAAACLLINQGQNTEFIAIDIIEGNEFCPRLEGLRTGLSVKHRGANRKTMVVLDQR